MGKYIGLVGSIASIIAFLIFDEIKLFMTIVAILGLFVAIGFEVRDYINNHPKKFTTEKNVKYLGKIIESPGDVMIFAGEMSWLINEKIKKILIDKAASGKLSICAIENSEFLDKLKQNGADVYIYGSYFSSELLPKARFTIIRANETNPMIAITSIDDDSRREKRMVYEAKSISGNYMDHWIVQTAKDLFNVMRVVDEFAKQKTGTN